MKKNKIQPKNYLFVSIVCAVLVVYTICMFVMLYYTVVTSLKEELFDYGKNKMGLPEEWMWENYKTAFSSIFKDVDSGTRRVYLPEMFMYSFYYSVIAAFLRTLVPCVVAYLVAKYRTWMNKVIYTIVIFAMTVPIVGALPSEIQIVEGLGLRGTLFYPIVANCSFLGMYFLLFHGTFKGLSNEYIEAATIDGAGQWQVMLNIVFPLTITTFGAVFLLNFIAYWNDYQTPLIYMNNFPTAAVGLFSSGDSTGGDAMTEETIRMAGCMLLFLPIFTLFIIFKNKLMGNLTVGGIKG
jgi:ABC-type glycerol-3-phosphate transport system permease component